MLNLGLQYRNLVFIYAKNYIYMYINTDTDVFAKNLLKLLILKELFLKYIIFLFLAIKTR